MADTIVGTQAATWLSPYGKCCLSYIMEKNNLSTIYFQALFDVRHVFQYLVFTSY
jgi:hypothetical protein